MGDRTKLERVTAEARPRLASVAASLLVLGLAAGAAHAQSVQLDPAGSNVILTAVNWLQGTLLGNVATALAVIAVAATGLLMLTGRIDWRRGATVILGCFIVFGAAAIVAGIRSVAAGT
jgi:type IV secretion system protein VirB2